MAHYRIIDTASWPRRDHFTFYRQFANPSFNLCVPIAAQRLYECAKDRRVSFFQLALYALLRAANGVPQLRQRMRNGEVIEYDSLAVMTPVMTVEEGFRQVWCDNAPEFTTFSDAATPKIVAARETTPAPLIVDGEHFICASCLPWLHFTSMTMRNMPSARRSPRSPGENCRMALSRWPGGLTMPSSMVSTPAAFMPLSKRDLMTPSGSGCR